MSTTEATPRPDLAVLHEAYCVPSLLLRHFRHEDLWQVLGSVADDARGISRAQIGTSVEGRPLYSVTFGHGPTRVLMWSQMHGDEPSHTMALVDLYAYWAREPEDPRVKRLGEALTVVAVPMLNPDGAERFDRRNAQGIDLNTDARAWVTPELRALRDLYLSLQPRFALNLHDQDPRKRVGKSDRLTALALLACPFDAERHDNDTRLDAKRLGGVVRRAVQEMVGDHIARYPDEYDGRTIGEHFQAHGTSTLLVECGYWPDDPEKQYLREMSFVGVLAALEAIADGSYASVPLEEYDSLEENDDEVFDVLVRGGRVVVPGLEPFRADLGIAYDSPLDECDGTVEGIGDLSRYASLRAIDAADRFLHPLPEMLLPREGARPTLACGRPASFDLREGPDPGSRLVLSVRDGGVVE